MGVKWRASGLNARTFAHHMALHPVRSTTPLAGRQFGVLYTPDNGWSRRLALWRSWLGCGQSWSPGRYVALRGTTTACTWP